MSKKASKKKVVVTSSGGNKGKKVAPTTDLKANLKDGKLNLSLQHEDIKGHQFLIYQQQEGGKPTLYKTVKYSDAFEETFSSTNQSFGFYIVAKAKDGKRSEKSEIVWVKF